MKTIIRLALSLLMLLPLSAGAADGVYVGYCEGAIATSSSNILGYTGSATMEWSIRLGKEQLATYVGGSITAVRVGMPVTTSTYPTIKVWVRSTVDGENLAEGSSDVAQGWNSIALDKGVEITEDSEFYVGFSYAQESKLNIVSFAGTTNADGCYFRKGTGTATSFSSRNLGSLSIEAEVKGGGTIANDLSIASASIDKTMVKAGDVLSVTCNVRNLGTAQVNGFKVAYSIAGGASGEKVCTEVLDYRASTTLTFDVNVGAHAVANDIPLTLTVSTEGVSDEKADDNTIVLPFCVYGETFPHTVLLEEFTTEGCGNCPTGAYKIHSALEDESVKDCVLMTCHHAAFGTDWLTHSASEMYMDLYGTAETFAPSWMLDRNAAFSDRGYPVSNLPSQPESKMDLAIAEMVATLKQAIAQPAFVKVTPTCVVTPGKVSVTVDLEKNISMLGQCANPVLTVFLVEDGITPIMQKDYTHLHPLTMHNNVLRGVLTPTWGASITWQGDKSSATYDFDIPAACKPENMRVIAFVSEFGMSVNERRVFNTGGCRLIDFIPEGIESISAENAAVPSAIYNLQGQTVRTATKGVYIVNGKKVLVK